MSLEDDLAIFGQLDDERLAEIAFPAAEGIIQEGLYSGTRLEKIKAVIRNIRASGSDGWSEVMTILNDDAVRGDVGLALVLIPAVGHALGLEGDVSAEVVAFALLLARLGKH